jgi:GntR family transcriptional regulator
VPDVRRVTRTPWREQGKGSPWVADAKRAGLIGSWESDSEFRVPCTADIAARLGIAEGDPCTRTDYLFTTQAEPRDDHHPVMLSTSWEPHDITGRTAVIAPEAGPMRGRGVVERMRAIGVEVVRTVEITGARPAREDEARRLAVPPTVWLLTITRTYHGIVDGAERPVETADLRYPADRYEAVYDIPLPRTATGDVDPSAVTGQS